jgi:hypothetical protein
VKGSVRTRDKFEGHKTFAVKLDLILLMNCILWQLNQKSLLSEFTGQLLACPGLVTYVTSCLVTSAQLPHENVRDRFGQNANNLCSNCDSKK